MDFDLGSTESERKVVLYSLIVGIVIFILLVLIASLIPDSDRKSYEPAQVVLLIIGAIDFAVFSLSIAFIIIR